MADEPLSKASAMPVMSLGLFVSLAVALFFGGRDLGKWKAVSEAEHKELVTRMTRLEDRFGKYSGMDGVNTNGITELNRLMLDLEKELSVILDQEVGR